MVDIFISYSSHHRSLTRELAEAIEKRFGAGSVWWDQAGLRAGDQFSPEITRALDGAKAVVVVWTDGAVDSTWVYAEAVRAASQRKVVTVVDDGLDPNRIPLPFNVYHNASARDFDAILASIEERLSGQPSPLPSTLRGQGFRSFLLDPKQEWLPPHAIATRPASLLLAKHRLVPFDDFHGVRAAIVKWATEEPPHALGRTALGRLVHAPAGLGKTRALIEIAEALTKDYGWLAGFVPRDVRGTGRESSEGALERLILSGRDVAGLMLIVDYAESRQADVTWLAEKLVQRAQNIARPSRLVLLSRGSGVWWNELLRKNQHLQELFSLGGDAYDEFTIPEQIAPFDRRALFDTSVSSFRRHGANLGAPQGDHARSDDLMRAIDTEDDYDRPLAVQIAALLHVAGVDAAEGRPGVASLLDRILGLEYEHWDKVPGIVGQRNVHRAIKNGVAKVTLAGGVTSRPAAEALVGSDPLFRSVTNVDVPSTCDALSLIFPAENDGLASLEPDLIGEHHVLEVLTDDVIDACVAWAGENRDQRQHVLTVLNRATRQEHGLKVDRAVAQLDRLVKTHAATLGGDLVKVAFETPGRLLDLCPGIETQLASLDEPALAAIDEALPPQSLTLMELSMSVAVRRADTARALVAAVNRVVDASDEERKTILNHLAACLDALGIRLAAVGRREEALAAGQEAVDIRRRLAHAQPDAFSADFASSLDSLGNRLSELGRREQALAVSQEAVDMYRRIAEARPDSFLPSLASSLSNHGGNLNELGRRAETLAAIGEAVDIYRRLTRERPEAFLLPLAGSLTNMGVALSRLMRREEALAVSEEAAEIYRRLAHARPDAFLPDFATSLNNLGNRLSQLGRLKEALAASQEAANIRRRLAHARPEAFLPDLAMSLNNLGVNLNSLMRREEALVVSKEAVDIGRRLAHARPDTFLPDLAVSLSNLAVLLSNLGRPEEALTASHEAVDIYRRLAHAQPTYLPDLARSISVMSVTLTALDRHPHAAQAASEALGHLASFVERYPQAYAGLARTILDRVERYSAAAGIDPDQALIERVLRALPAGEPA
jgi:tetratricopeptide (TPR) repeat protein